MTLLMPLCDTFYEMDQLKQFLFLRPILFQNSIRQILVAKGDEH